MAAVLHWKIYQHFGFVSVDKWYPDMFIEDEKTFVGYELSNGESHRNSRLDIVVLNKEDGLCYFIDVFCQVDTTAVGKGEKTWRLYTIKVRNQNILELPQGCDYLYCNQSIKKTAREFYSLKLSVDFYKTAKIIFVWLSMNNQKNTGYLRL